MVRYSKLFEPIWIGKIKLRNRFVMPAMVTNYCGPDGKVTERLIAYLRARARGGVGLIISEAAFVHQSGRGFFCELGIDSDELLPGLRRLADAIHEEGGKIAVQLHHSGRQTYPTVTGMPLIAPSPIPCPICRARPEEMTRADILQLLEAFGAGARRAREAGFDAVEIHGGHGYLLNQFLSPYSNRRTDEYGGAPAKRARFPLEVVKKVREMVGSDFPLLYRMSADEFVPGGLTIQETKIFAQILVDSGIQAINVSGSVYESAALMMSSFALPGLHVENASAIKKAIGGKIPIIVVGRLQDPMMMEQLVAGGQVDMIAIGRGLLADEALPAKIRAGKLADIRKCILCNQGCVGRLNSGKDIACLGNAMTGREWQYDLSQKAPQKKKVLVAGGGPGGLEAARIAALRGHEVFLYEKAEKLGGLFNYAILSPARSDFEDLRSYLITQVEKLGVCVQTGCAVDEEIIGRLQPDVVIMATGSRPIIPNIPGLNRKEAKTAEEILAGAHFGKNIVIIGGGAVGCETAEFLADRGARVTVVEMLKGIARDMEPTGKRLLMRRLKEKGVILSTNTVLREVKPSGELLLQKESRQETLKGVDTLVLAVGYQPVTDIEGMLNDKKVSYIKIGDCFQSRNIIDAIWEGFRGAYEL